MKTQIGLDAITCDDRSVLTVGTFDGVHLGHQAVLDYLNERAARVDGRSVVVSFDPHPREVVTGERVPLLTTLDERAALLQAHGIDRFVVLPFTRDLSNLAPEAYVEQILLGTIGLREIVIGYDHRFGKNRAGDRSTLERLGAARGFSVDVIPEQLVQDPGSSPGQARTVSSSAIRRRLEAGDVAGVQEPGARARRPRPRAGAGDVRDGLPESPEPPHRCAGRAQWPRKRATRARDGGGRLSPRGIVRSDRFAPVARRVEMVPWLTSQPSAP